MASVVLVVDEEVNEVFLLKWKTFKKDARKGRELDPRFFNPSEKAAFTEADEKEWQSFIDTGAIEIVAPQDAKSIARDRIFTVPMRYVRTNKDKI